MVEVPVNGKKTFIAYREKACTLLIHGQEDGLNSGLVIFFNQIKSVAFGNAGQKVFDTCMVGSSSGLS